MAMANALDVVMWIGQLFERGFNTPNFTSILADGTIAREFSAASNVMNSHLKPLRLILKWERKN
jgi:hypothetical protein